MKNIYDFIAVDNPGAAVQVITGIYAKAQLLTQFPEIGYRYDKHQNDDIRILLYGHYRIAYLVRADGDVDILGVFHGALDMQRYLL
ncbi:MAG: type II toxin-antitoxin system RelE/ParE family toxin [Sulfuricaulis sp.]|uniref:type II toxin-antitoxin system RelE/ParE family toxin n=1 Tax=Sulfuricaulis sp. TaxID=2003553 RepID=UPI003C474872